MRFNSKALILPFLAKDQGRFPQGPSTPPQALSLPAYKFRYAEPLLGDAQLRGLTDKHCYALVIKRHAVGVL